MALISTLCLRRPKARIGERTGGVVFWVDGGNASESITEVSVHCNPGDGRTESFRRIDSEPASTLKCISYSCEGR
jgi:hypothetical protein